MILREANVESDHSNRARRKAAPMIGLARIGALLREPDYRRIWGAGVATGICV